MNTLNDIKTKTWLMSKEQFLKYAKSVRHQERVQHLGSFSYSRHAYTWHYVYVDINTLEVINIFSKKHSGRKYKSFHSISSSSAKEEAYEWILKQSSY